MYTILPVFDSLSANLLRTSYPPTVYTLTICAITPSPMLLGVAIAKHPTVTGDRRSARMLREYTGLNTHFAIRSTAAARIAGLARATLISHTTALQPVVEQRKIEYSLGSAVPDYCFVELAQISESSRTSDLHHAMAIANCLDRAGMI